MTSHNGHRIKRYMYTPLPYPPHPIARLHEISDEDSQKLDLDFCDCHRDPIKGDPLNDPTTINNSDIAWVDEIDFNNTEMNRLGDKGYNDEI